ncbi:hypothetical protein PCASD_02401 [Puccinia coronata f. sp. avenae]|uniref:DUF3752 domain-containing protein n=1 Tax=Puccinia coronata f. sp. avenae TaxID=200324 RepID=A0A2N5VM55_9BASI|nr:hypothetical protein PCASD_02401 [Puccinia coronata f. sp. avenae]
MALPLAGPSTPPTNRAKQDNKKTNGPAHENQSQAQVDGNDSDSSDDFMPTLPPNFSKPKLAPAAPIGPKLPAGYTVSEARHTGDDVSDHGDDDDDDDDDDDVAGPAPLPAHLSSSLSLPNEGVIALREREERQKELDRIERESKVLKRDEWMLLPPKEFDLKTAIDPTKIKARGFKQTSKPHASSTEGSRTTASSSLWTETPAERSQRLADEAIGKRRRAEEVAKGGTGDDDDDLEASKRKKRDHLMRQQVDQHNKSLRHASLLDLHKTANTNVSNSKTRSEKETDKKQKVVWDHDAMMGVNSKLLSDNQKANMINDAKGLGGRFGGGSFL